MRQMPCARPPPIRELKVSAGFPDDDDGEVYRSWRKAARREMERQEIFSSSNPGRAQWAELTRWSLTWVPLSDRATLYKGTSAEAVEFTAAVDGLLADVLKKLNHSRRGEVSLDPPPAPPAAQESTLPFLPA